MLDSFCGVIAVGGTPQFNWHVILSCALWLLLVSIIAMIIYNSKMKLIAVMKSFLLQQGVRRLCPLPAVGSKGRGTPDTTAQPPAWLVCHDLHLQQIYEAVSQDFHSWYFCKMD